MIKHLDIVWTNQFKKDYKLAMKRHLKWPLPKVLLKINTLQSLKSQSIKQTSPSCSTSSLFTYWNKESTFRVSILLWNLSSFTLLPLRLQIILACLSYVNLFIFLFNDKKFQKHICYCKIGCKVSYFLKTINIVKIILSKKFITTW